MAHLTKVKTNTDVRGSLSFVESMKDIPFEIKRVFYIYGVNPSEIRGAHRHHKTKQALICVAGSCVVSSNDGKNKNNFVLDSPEKCLILNPEDYHTMHDFSNGSILLVLASEYYDKKDYIHEDYK